MKKLTKLKLQDIINAYDFQLDLLDLAINDISNISINEIQEWIDETRKIIENIKCEKTQEQKYYQLKIFYEE